MNLRCSLSCCHRPAQIFVSTDGSREIRRGFKKSKARLTGLVCTNADGSDKLKPLVIGKAKVPVALRRVNMDALLVLIALLRRAG